MLADKIVGSHTIATSRCAPTLQAAEKPDAKETKLMAVQAIGDETEAKLNAARRIRGMIRRRRALAGKSTLTCRDNSCISLLIELLRQNA